jgi:hypothetical protein
MPLQDSGAVVIKGAGRKKGKGHHGTRYSKGDFGTRYFENTGRKRILQGKALAMRENSHINHLRQVDRVTKPYLASVQQRAMEKIVRNAMSKVKEKK